VVSRLAERRAQQLTTERTQELQAEMTELRAERDAAIRARDATLAGARSLVGHGNGAVVRLQGQLDELATMAKRNAASLHPYVRDLVNVLATIFTRWKADLGELNSYVAQFDHRPATGDPDRDSHSPSPR
jgi:ABC-type transporter Mla subunit MlaD